MEDTIAAISTTLGVGAISIIRVSGTEAISIANNVFKGKDLTKVNSHTINYGHIIDNEEIVDEVLISVMRAPRTFTMEDIVEINCHGGVATTNRVLEILLSNGCRLAEPGEFTKRAFLNGRIDLIEAEGIMDLINSKTNQAASVALNQVDGKVSNLIKSLRQEIIEILANIEVNIDYPEYEDIEEYTLNQLKKSIIDIKEKINEILNESRNGQLIKDGIKVSIIGKPNVGKSSILNRLLDEEKAIVTDVEGTTRDLVEGTINIDGLVLNIIDTAGIRKTDNIVENIGVNKSIELMNNSDLVLFVLNNNEEMDIETKELINSLKDKNYIIIINKIDLPTRIEKINNENIIYLSAKTNEGIDALKKKIKKLYDLDNIEKKDMTYLTSARSISLLRQALKSILSIENGLLENMPIDMLEIDLKEVWNLLGEIIGETYQDELIDQLFSQFCLGK